MKLQIIAAAALALSMGTAAYAQSTGAGSSGIGTAANERVEPSLGQNNMFFNESGAMRSADEVSTAWRGMSAEQQASVRTECESIRTADASANATAGQGTASTETTASTGTTATGATSKVEGTRAAMTELCAWVATQ